MELREEELGNDRTEDKNGGTERFKGHLILQEEFTE